MTSETNEIIILIGPMCAGKSTIAQLVSKQYHVPRYEVDELRWSYYEQIGYSQMKADQILETQGFMALLAYWKPFEAYAVESILSESDKGIIDFGAGHTVYEENNLFQRVKLALEPYPHVFYLLPDPDIETSISILNTRFAQLLQSENVSVTSELLEANTHFVTHPSNEKLAKRIVYTNKREISSRNL